jgi:hypothetical protein
MERLSDWAVWPITFCASWLTDHLFGWTHAVKPLVAIITGDQVAQAILDPRVISALIAFAGLILKLAHSTWVHVSTNHAHLRAKTAESALVKAVHNRPDVLADYRTLVERLEQAPRTSVPAPKSRARKGVRA